MNHICFYLKGLYYKLIGRKCSSNKNILFKKFLQNQKLYKKFGAKQFVPSVNGYNGKSCRPCKKLYILPEAPENTYILSTFLERIND